MPTTPSQAWSERYDLTSSFSKILPIVSVANFTRKWETHFLLHFYFVSKRRQFILTVSQMFKWVFFHVFFFLMCSTVKPTMTPLPFPSKYESSTPQRHSNVHFRFCVSFFNKVWKRMYLGVWMYSLVALRSTSNVKWND